VEGTRYGDTRFRISSSGRMVAQRGLYGYRVVRKVGGKCGKCRELRPQAEIERYSPTHRQKTAAGTILTTRPFSFSTLKSRFDTM